VRQDGNQRERNVRGPLLMSDLHYVAVGKMSLRRRSRLLELVGSYVAAAPADYTRYL
jgi:hypothetical protein